ncbi:DTW domain-containing protein 2 [Fukomys damarensis]|uniref:DTW domain-containing protein 2 n=1 Tax=Fukomys damarensis TaxID=885580 RepID=UPI00053FC154|nr:DTW domain-containing protein 2 [Fukomys damarensis]
MTDTDVLDYPFVLQQGINKAPAKWSHYLFMSLILGPGAETWPTPPRGPPRTSTRHSEGPKSLSRGGSAPSPPPDQSVPRSHSQQSVRPATLQPSAACYTSASLWPNIARFPSAAARSDGGPALRYRARLKQRGLFFSCTGDGTLDLLLARHCGGATELNPQPSFQLFNQATRNLIRICSLLDTQYLLPSRAPPARSSLHFDFSKISRPQKVCLCPFLPVHPLHISTHLYIIQHPAEENKVLRTVPLLEACLPQDKCKVKIGRRFSEERDIELSAVCRKSGTLILYPGAEAANLEEFILDSPVYPSTIIIIDGTWSQAKDIFYKNSLFRLPKQVQLKTNISSQYVIRMQPTNRCLSTLECAAIALSILEKNNYIQETLLRPLQALCSFQLQHGAQIRLSKEYLLKNGLYPKPMPKNKRKLRKMELLMNSVKI